MSSTLSGSRDSPLSLRSSSQATNEVDSSQPRAPQPSFDGTSTLGSSPLSPWNQRHRGDFGNAASSAFPRTRSTIAGFDFSTMTGAMGSTTGSLPSTSTALVAAGHRESFAALTRHKNTLGAFDVSRNHLPTASRPHVFHLDPLNDIDADVPRMPVRSNGTKSASGPWQPPKIGVLLRSTHMSPPPNRLPRIDSPVNTASPSFSRATTLPSPSASPSHSHSSIESRLGLRTGEDCVLFFGTAGHSKHGLRCIFLVPAPTLKKKFRPYDLIVAQSHEISSEYFTMTPDGVTHVCPGVPSKFTALADWMRESSMFNALSALPFMQFFYLGKAHSRLSSSLRKSAYERSRHSVERLSMYTSVCYGSDSFGQVLRRVAGMCHLVNQVQLFDCKEIRHCRAAVEFPEFKSAQFGVMEAGVLRLHKLAAEAVEVMARFAEETVALAVRPLEGQIGDMVPGTEPTVVGFQGIKHKGMVQLRADRQASDAKLANIHYNIARLRDLARTCDYMMCAALLAVAQAAVAEIESLVSNPPKKFGYFSILLCLGEEPRAIDLAPSADDVANGLKDIDNAMCSSLNKLPRILHAKQYAHVMQGCVTGLVLPQVLESDASLQASRRVCGAVLANNFMRGADFAKDFAELWAIKLHCMSFDLAQGLQVECANDNRTVELLNSAKFIKKEMQTLKRFTADLERKKMSSHLGALQVDGRALRASLSASINSCLEVVRLQLHEVARTSCAHVLAEFSTHLKALQKRPNSLKEFTVFLDAKAIIGAEVRNLYLLSAAVDDMYRLLNSVDVRITAAEHVKLDDLHSIHGKVVETLSNADSDCASRMPVMSQALDKSVAAVNEELLNMLTLLHSGIYDNPESSTKNVLRELAICNENIDAMQEKISVYTRYQVTFKISPYDFSYLRTVRDYCLDRIDIWSKLDAFRSMVAKIYETPFDSSVSSAFRTMIEQTNILATAAVKKNDADKIAAKYMSELKAHAAYSDIVEALGNTALRPRHWKLIYARIGMGVADDRMPKFRELLKHKVEAAASAIIDISSCATGENALQVQMAAVEMKLPLWTLEFSADGPVENFEQLIADMESAAFVLQGVVLSRFCDIVGDRLQAVTADVHACLRVMRNMNALQRLWMLLRGVMESPEGEVIMPEEHAKFMPVNGAWKELLLRTRKRNPQVHALVTAKDSAAFEARLLEYTTILETCALKLDQFVDLKCQLFPRLLLMHRSDLIQLLSHGAISQANVELYQTAARACFPGLEELQFHVGSKEDGGSSWLVKGIKPLNARSILLDLRVAASSAVDKWFQDTLRSSRSTLQSATDSAVSGHCSAKEDDWMLQQPKQCVILALRVIMQQTITSVLIQIQDGTAAAQSLSALARECDAKSKERSKRLYGDTLHAADRSTVIACVLLAMHFRDTLHILDSGNCATVDDFAWSSMLRMVWLQKVASAPSSYAAKLFDYDVPYGFDVSAGESEHVVTLQTARFNVGVVAAMRSSCCCHALYGPSGSGKTSLMQNLAALLGISFISADVQAHVSVEQMPLLMTAAASSSVWIAFDHVQAWSTELLSCFSQALLSILADIRRASASTSALNNVSSHIDPSRGGVLFFITASEAFSQSISSAIGSAVSQNFRPSHVLMPDEFAVAEAFFVLQSFDSARELAKKMQYLFTEWRALLPAPCPELSIKHLASIASCARRVAGSSQVGLAREMECVGIAVRLIVVSRCPPELMDVVKTQVDLLFAPAAPAVSSHQLWPLHSDAVKSAFVKAQLTWSDGMGVVAAHLCSTIQMSTAVAVVGGCCSGKSALIAVASAHISSLKPAVEMVSIDPDCCANQLFSFRAGGVVVDGILSSVFNSPSEIKEESNCKWLHCDGDISTATDALLSHRLVVQVLESDPATCFDRILFETDSLHRASPSLVRRLSIVYCPAGMLQHKIFLEDLVKALKFSNKTTQQQVAELVLSLLPSTLELLFPNACGSDDAAWWQRRQLMLNVVHLVACMFTSEACDLPQSACAKLFTFCLFWGLAGGIDRCIWDETSSSYLEGDKALEFLGARVRSVCCTAVMLPPVGQAEDLREYSVSSAGDWCRWDAMLDDPLPIRGCSDIYVQNSRTAPCLHILTSLMVRGQHAALTGCRGSGKSVLVAALTAKLALMSSPTSSSAVFSVATFRHLSSGSCVPAPALQAFLGNRLQLSNAGLYAPASSANLVVVIDDLSTCPRTARPSLNAAVRQFFGSAPVGSRSALGAMYDPQKCGISHRIVGTSVLVTASTLDVISPRAARYLVPLQLAAPSEAHLRSVFESVAAAAFSSCALDVRSLVSKLAAATVSVYYHMLRASASNAATFFPLPHPSDCMKVINGCVTSGSANTGSSKTLQRVWLHEMCRVFRDRFGTIGCSDFDRVFKAACSSTLEMQVTDANISQLWTRFHSLDSEVLAPVSSIELAVDLLRARLSEYHKKHKERLSLVLDRTSVSAISFIVRVLQQPWCHCALLDYEHANSHALCFFSGFIADFSVIEVPAIDSAASTSAFLRAAAQQCIEENTRVVLIVREEALVFDRVLELVTALARCEASAIFEENDLLHLAERVPALMSISGGSSMQHIDKYVSEALQRNLKVILLGSSGPESPITSLPHASSWLTFHSSVQPQSTFFSAALRDSLGSGFESFSSGGLQAEGIADAMVALRDSALIEADRTHLSSAMKQKLVGADCCLFLVQVFCAEMTRTSEALASSITLTQSSLSACTALKTDAEESHSKAQHLQQQIDHSRIAQKDIAETCSELKAATVCRGRPPLQASKARLQLLGFSDHILVDCLSGVSGSFAECIGEALFVVLDVAVDDSYGLPQDYFKGNEALARIKDALKKKGCTPQADSTDSSWILEGISRHAAVKQDSIIRLHLVLARGSVQNVFSSSGGAIEDVMDDFDKCIVEFLVSLHDVAREEELRNSEDILEAAVQQEIDFRNTLDEIAAVHASLAKLCDSLKPLEQKWASDLDAFHTQQNRMVGDALQIAVQLVWGVLFPPEHRGVLVMRASECLSFHGIDTTNSILELNTGFMPFTFSVYESFAVSSLLHRALGPAWTLCSDPDQRLLPALQQHLQSSDNHIRTSCARTDDPLFANILERCIHDGHVLVVHVVDPSVPAVLLDLVRTRSLRIFGRHYLRIGSRMLEMHRNFALVMQLTLLRADDVPALQGPCRLVDFTLHEDSLAHHLAASMVFGKTLSTEQSSSSDLRAASSYEALSKCESLIMRLVTNPAMRTPSTALELIESAHVLLAEQLVHQSDFKEQKDQLEQLPAALASHKDVAKAAACMLRNLRAMRLIAPEAGCTLPMLLDIFFHITQSLKHTVSDSPPIMFNILSRHMAPVPRLIFAVLYACSIDPQFTAPELDFLHSPIGLNVTPAVDGYELPNTRELEWLPLHVWARVAALTVLPGVGVDVLKSLRTYPKEWKKWYLSIEKGAVEQFPDGFSKKLTPLQGACLARCFSERLLHPTLQLYVARTLGVAYDESRMDSQWMTKASMPVPVVVSEGEGSHAVSAVIDMRLLVHGDNSISCVVAHGSNWPTVSSNVSKHLSAGRWVVVCCMGSMPWESFVQLYESASKYHNASCSRLFIVCSASGSIPRDANAMCLHWNASTSSSPGALFDAIYTNLLPLALPHNKSGMSVSQAYKHLATSRHAVFQLACCMVLAVQHDAFVNATHTQDMRNKTFLKVLGARCASAANALFRHLKEFPVANLPKGYSYAAVDDIVTECLKELSHWAPLCTASRFVFSLSSILGSSAPSAALHEQSSSDVLKHMATFCWPSTMHQLKIDVSQLTAAQGRVVRQLQAGLQTIPCMHPCRPMPLTPFDSKQLLLMLDFLPPEREIHQLLQRPDCVSAVDDMVACVGRAASMSMVHVCNVIQQLRALVRLATGYSLGVASSFDLLSCAGSTALFPPISEFSLFTSAGIMSLRAVVEQRVVPRYQALKSAGTSAACGVPLGAFHVPYRLLSGARAHAARSRRLPIESLRVQASVVADLEKMGLPILAVCDVFARNAIFTTNKANDRDTLIFSAQSAQPQPLAFLFPVDAEGDVKHNASAAAVAALPIVLQSEAESQGALFRVMTLVDVILDGVDTAQLGAENVYLAVRKY